MTKFVGFVMISVAIVADISIVLTMTEITLSSVNHIICNITVHMMVIIRYNAMACT